MTDIPDVFQDRGGTRHYITNRCGLRPDGVTEYAWCADCKMWLLLNATAGTARPV